MSTVIYNKQKHFLLFQNNSISIETAHPETLHFLNHLKVFYKHQRTKCDIHFISNGGYSRPRTQQDSGTAMTSGTRSKANVMTPAQAPESHDMKDGWLQSGSSTAEL